MKRTLILFVVVVVAATYLWPWLREIGLVRLPIDIVADVSGYRLHVPLGLSLLISAAVSGAWWLLDPPR